ncbi:MAG: hypothetical protein P4N59_13620 [Negativicutes bacterium]|nr:hypothetical protein [Negativicutes bacterium]
MTLPAYIADGWASIAYPVNGYLVVPSKFIFLVSASVSFIHLPEIAYWLTIGMTIAILTAIAYCPTYLRWPKLCALAIPPDSEVFAVLEYAFW